MTKTKINYHEINQLLLLSATTILKKWLPEGRFEGDEYVALNTKRHDTKLGSFKTNIRTGVWNDFAIGVGGRDLISLYAYIKDLSQSEAARQLYEYIWSSPAADRRKKACKPKLPNNKYAIDIWNKGLPIQGTLAEAYLAKRHLTDLPKNVLNKLRFCKQLKHAETGLFLPALIACVEDVDDNIIAIQRIYLAPKTGNKANIINNKKTLGSIRGGAVKLTYEKKLIVTEGVEDAITLLIHWPGYAVWAGLGGNALSIDVTNYNFPEVIIALDNDVAGRAMAPKLKQRLLKQGVPLVKIKFPEGAKDFNEMHIKGEM